MADTEREAFEAWIRDDAEEYDFDPESDGFRRMPNNRYYDQRWNNAWSVWKARAALASRPAEVDDEGLPPLPKPMIPGSIMARYSPEQYRQGQRDAVAADRARRGLIGFVTDIQTTEYALRPSGRAVITCALTVRSTELWVPGRLWLIDPSKLRMPARGAA